MLENFRANVLKVSFHSEAVLNLIRQLFGKNNNNNIFAIMVAKFATHWLFAFHFVAYFKLTFESDWLCCITVPRAMDEKKMRFREKKIVRFVD